MAHRDHVEGERVIPLTPYLAGLSQGLPKGSAWVFSTARSDAAKIGKGKRSNDDVGKPQAPRQAGPIASPQKPHALACKAAEHRGPDVARAAPLVLKPDRMAGGSGGRGGVDHAAQAQRDRREALQGPAAGTAAHAP